MNFSLSVSQPYTHFYNSNSTIQIPDDHAKHESILRSFDTKPKTFVQYDCLSPLAYVILFTIQILIGVHHHITDFFISFQQQLHNIWLKLLICSAIFLDHHHVYFCNLFSHSPVSYENINFQFLHDKTTKQVVHFW